MDVRDPVSGNKNTLSMWFLPLQELQCYQVNRCSLPRDEQFYCSLISLYQIHTQNHKSFSSIDTQLKNINLSCYDAFHQQPKKINSKTLPLAINELMTHYSENKRDQKREYQFFTIVQGKNDDFFLNYCLQKRYYCQPYFKNLSDDIGQLTQRKKAQHIAPALLNLRLLSIKSQVKSVEVLMMCISGFRNIQRKLRKRFDHQIC